MKKEKKKKKIELHPDKAFYRIPTGEQATEQGTPLGELYLIISKQDYINRKPKLPKP